MRGLHFLLVHLCQSIPVGEGVSGDDGHHRRPKFVDNPGEESDESQMMPWTEEAVNTD